MPRHMLLATDRFLTDKAIPGTRCVITGIYTVSAEKKEVCVCVCEGAGMSLVRLLTPPASSS